MFFAGAGFLSLATLVTRRSIARKLVATRPKFFTQSNLPSPKISSDGSIALEALNLATLNVMGFAIMMTGGVTWAFDISSLDDLRRMAQGHVGTSRGFKDEEAERELEEWVTKVLLPKDKKDDEANPTPTAAAAAATEGRGD
jgi:hypothetical protein